MKLLPIVLLLLFQNTYSQTEVRLVFWDSCENKIFTTEFEANKLDNADEFYSSTDSKAMLPLGEYIISFGKFEDDIIYSASEIVEIKDSKNTSDTLILPKIRHGLSGAPNSGDYYNCKVLCNGDVKEFYPNGKLRLEGNFKKGKPSVITEYRPNGSKRIKEWYRQGTMEYDKIEYYDEKSQRIRYELYKIVGNKEVKEVYDGKGNFLRKE